MNEQFSGQAASFSNAALTPQMTELSLGDSAEISGGNIFNVIGAARLGWDIGSYIDRRFIAPLWY